MVETLQIRLTPETAHCDTNIAIEVAKALRVDITRIKKIETVKRSVDARQRHVFIMLTLRIHLDAIDTSFSITKPEQFVKLPDNAPQAIVVGAGPAGLFAALQLIQNGIRPVILERGKDVDERRKDLAAINRTGIVTPESNYCFGEGGAGAYSDGKLYTRSKKRGPVDKVLNILHQHGASADILVDAHPHIGSDRLPLIIKNIRNCIIDCGGEVHFNHHVTGLKFDKNGTVNGVYTADGKSFIGPVILATGHSARDVYYMLKASNISIEAKGLAIGVRLEHPQQLIDRLQYHSAQGRGKYLPAAEYSLLTRIDERAVYSFCMCPGGFIIPAASSPGEFVVNGMSPANRGTRWANSGMVVEILPEDIEGNDPLRMMFLQQDIEKAFYADAKQNAEKTDSNPLNAPAQALPDFIAGRPSTSLASSSYAPGVHPARIDKLLPSFIADRLRRGLLYFGKRQKGFITPQSTLIGCETRTSSPVRLPRDPETLQHTDIHGLYPAGEGAGYAGGIVSAAIDGIRVANSLAAALMCPLSHE